MGFSCGSAGKEFSCNAGDLGLIPGLGRSPGEGNGYPLQCSGLENPTTRPVRWGWPRPLSLICFSRYTSHLFRLLCRHPCMCVSVVGTVGLQVDSGTEDSQGSGSPASGRTLQKLKLRQPLMPQKFSRYTRKYWLNRRVLSKSDSLAQRCMTKVDLKKKGNQGNC